MGWFCCLQVSLPDCETTMAAHDIVASFSGCCGQRCMAAAVLLTVGEQSELIAKVVEKAGALKPGTVIAPLCVWGKNAFNGIVVRVMWVVCVYGLAGCWASWPDHRRRIQGTCVQLH
jgi:hypothetical protein